MEISLLFQMIIKAIGGLGLFLLGMKYMSEGMQSFAGDKLRSMINKVTDNRFMATGIGAAITALIQSSSVTTVMVVGMANAGIITLRQSIGVILGADIGTTITAWIISLKVAEYGLPLLGLSTFVYLFAQKSQIRNTAMMALGLGLVFFGLEIMKSGFYPLRSDQEFIALLAQFSPTTYFGLIKCVITGAFVTAVIQSSSATVAITITLAQTGFIDYNTAVALVLGENIGTTITAYLASMGATTVAKRTAFAHISIKVLGVMIMIPFFYYYLDFLKAIIPNTIPIGSRIAFAHTGFNLLVVSCFIWMIDPLAKMLNSLIKDKKKKERSLLKYLNVPLLDAPILGAEQSLHGVLRIVDGVESMHGWLGEALHKKRDDLESKLISKENEIDDLQKEIVEYINELMTHNLSKDSMISVRRQLRMADEYESISDYIIVILKLRYKMSKNSVVFSEEDKNFILHLHAMVSDYVKDISIAVRDEDLNILNKAMTESKIINRKVKQYRSIHLSKLGTKHNSPVMSLIFMDMLSAYRQIKDHAFNIAEVVAGEK
ncbi:MAG: Na/Pi cotransporter family protein [Candidatus Marinimicrobia bacterium]|nr:Na/Pi cotransporter family protein [Candidatus Neomarinimicrobiota bacterium]MBT3634497.1 Na/Pi cotransporter family protein [Candidatus Neomarinimicrobiota bacterium]MBT3683394.1 Na/Pi cotransporter family protein [Candidatus Neomarinimicrobiota bacterium]MBT3760282.1 Na/Pi cotransporter family protein [Candidatus Neomarinimicrobiota bacterium]MBT3896377.1 Na/Pi cotransporter family protein [Candidatus Neomarinimicrobiota bacterium]